MPFFSVVIPLYNKEAHIKATLQSVFAQTFKDFEIIVIDDGSTDQSLEIVKSFSDKRLRLFQQKNRGVSIARNFAIDKAISMHIALLDADDYWHPNHLEEFYKAIQKFPNAALYCNAYFLKLSANYTQKASYNISKMRLQKIKNYFENSMIHPLAMSSGVAFKKNEFEALGHYNPSIPSGQDLDLWIRFGLYKTIVFNPAFTSYYDKTVHASLSKGNFRENKYLLFHAYIEEEQKDPFLKKYLDLNRYSVALQCKYADDNFILKKLKKISIYTR